LPGVAEADGAADGIKVTEKLLDADAMRTEDTDVLLLIEKPNDAVSREYAGEKE